MISFNFKIWNTVLDKLIGWHKQDKKDIIEYNQDDLHYKLNTKSKTLTITEPNQSITIRNQKFIHPDQRKLVKKLKKM